SSTSPTPGGKSATRNGSSWEPTCSTKPPACSSPEASSFFKPTSKHAPSSTKRTSSPTPPSSRAATRPEAPASPKTLTAPAATAKSARSPTAFRSTGCVLLDGRVNQQEGGKAGRMLRAGPRNRSGQDEPDVRGFAGVDADVDRESAARGRGALDQVLA